MDIENMIAERDHLIHKMNELTSKYEIYVQSMSKERAETTSENANHVKLLSSKLLTILLDKWLAKNYKECFSAITLHSFKSSKQEWACNWLEQALSKLEARWMR